VIATGAKPAVPEIEGLENISYLTSDTIWSLREKPKKLLVLGGGPIGSELAQTFQRLGSQVTIVDRSDRLLSREDPEVSNFVMESFKKDGIDISTDHQVLRFVVRGDKKILLLKNNKNGEEREV